MARSTRSKQEEDHLIKQFRDFFSSVIKAQERAVESRETNPNVAAESVSKNLENLIELQTLESKRDGNRAELESIADARYLKASLADEILLNTEWVGRECWTNYLLEGSLFRTGIAGERIFEKIEELLSNREPSQRPIASLYLSALALGFQGKYRVPRVSDNKGVQTINASRSTFDNVVVHIEANAELHRSYREELFQFIYQRRPDFSGRDRVLSENAYASTLSHIAPRKMQTLSRWTVLFVFSLVALLTVSEILWLWQSWPVRQVLKNGSPVGVSTSK